MALIHKIAIKYTDIAVKYLLYGCFLHFRDATEHEGRGESLSSYRKGCKSKRQLRAGLRAA